MLGLSWAKGMVHTKLRRVEAWLLQMAQAWGGAGLGGGQCRADGEILGSWNLLSSDMEDTGKGTLGGV